MELLLGVQHFFIKLGQSMENIFFVIVAILAFLIGYPAQVGILIFALALFISDIATRFNAIRVENNGLYKAFLNKKLTSRGFWNGFLNKAIGYFITLMIANLLKVTPQINLIGDLLSTVLYCGLAFYEVISNLENLRDSGLLAVIPWLNKLKKEQDKFFESTIEDTVSKVTSESQNNENNDI
jgi:hypothetical protein